jgi:hypothetical protein
VEPTTDFQRDELCLRGGAALATIQAAAIIQQRLQGLVVSPVHAVAKL